MSDFKNAMDYGKSPWDLDLYEVASATTAQIGIARAYGLDQAMESLYGQDGQVTQAVDWAYQEGGWDPFWSLALFGIHGMASDWFDDHPEWGNFDRYRTGWPTGTWINGTGPISSPIPNVTGYTEIPMWPAALTLGPGKCLPEDDAECATGGFKNYAYYNIYNSFNPSLIWSPSLSVLIWAQMTKEQRCWTIDQSLYWVGLALIVTAKTRIGTAVPPLEIGLIVTGAVIAGAQLYYCTKR